MPPATLSPARRGVLLAAAALQVLPAVQPFLQGGALDLGLTVWLLGSLAAGAFLVGSLFREGGRAALLAVAALAFALLFAAMQESPFHVAVGLAMGGAVAALLRADRLGAGIAAVGVAVETAALWALTQSRGPPQEGADALGYVALAGALLFAAGVVVGVARAPRTAGRPLGPRGRMAFALGGAAVLALSFSIGGHLLFLPLWPLAFVLLLAPPLLRWRALGPAAALVGGLALVGLAPVGECTVDPWSDAPPPEPVDDTTTDRATLYEMAGSGPGWQEGGGFSGQAVHCPPLALGVAVAWALALVAACVFCARLEPRTS